MSSSHKIASGVFWSVVVNLVNAVYGFIAAPMLIRYFGRSEYGIIALAQSANAYMFLFDMGLSSTNVRFFAKWISEDNKTKINKLMQTCTSFYGCVGLINVAVLMVFYILSDRIFNVTPQQNDILKPMILVLMATALINWYTSCWGQIISATENVAWMQKRTLLSKAFMIVVLILTLVLKLSILEYFVATIIAGLTLIPLTYSKLKKLTPYVSVLPKFDKEIFKEILPYSLNIFSFGLFQAAFYNSRTFFLGIQGNVESVTDFNVMNSIANMVCMVSGVFIGALLPSAAKVVANGDKSNFYRVAYQGTRFVSIVLCFCSFGIMSISSDLMLIYVGADYLHLVPWLNLWALFLISSHNSAISSLILAGNDVRAITYSTLIASVVGALVTWFSIPYLFAGGPVLGYAVYTTIQILFYYLYYWPAVMKIDSLMVFKQSFSFYLVSGAVIWFFVSSIPHTNNHWANVLLFGSMFAVIYLLVVYYLLNKEDKEFILSTIKRKRN